MAFIKCIDSNMVSAELPEMILIGTDDRRVKAAWFCNREVVWRGDYQCTASLGQRSALRQGTSCSGSDSVMVRDRILVVLTKLFKLAKSFFSIFRR